MSKPWKSTQAGRDLGIIQRHPDTLAPIGDSLAPEALRETIKTYSVTGGIVT